MSQDNPKFHSQYVQSLKIHLQESYKLAQKNAAKSAERNKIRFDRKVTESSLEEGDRVLVRNVRVRGKHKLADRWDPVVHIVVSRAGELPVYTVKPERQDGPLRTLHRDLLLPCGFLSPLMEDETDVTKPQRKRVTRQNRDEETDECQENYQSSDEDDYVPQFSEVPAIPTQRVIREYNVVRKPKDVSSNSDAEIQSSVPSHGTETGNARNIPRRDDSSEMERLPDIQYLPETQSSSCGTGPVKENLKERSHLPQVEQQTLDVPDGNEKGNDTQAVQVEESVPDVPLRRRRTESAESAELTEPEDGTDQSASEDEIQLRRSKRVKQKSKRLTYPEMGNPMISIIQSLLQGLNTAFVETLAEHPKPVRHPKL